mgnify:CR=1 FL=1
MTISDKSGVSLREVSADKQERSTLNEHEVFELLKYGWTPLFLNIGALVMETGGPISHGSVVAREYGIPAVVGATQVTKKLEDGQVVKVNGETGQIEVLSD